MANKKYSDNISMDRQKIISAVPDEIKGNYILRRKEGGKDKITYVGRSDTNLRERLLQHLHDAFTYTSFYWMKASSEKEAFEQECRDYHHYKPIDNKYHPDRPEGTSYPCPCCLHFDDDRD